jgi:DNA-binding transcriptional LysR family regulator
MPVRRPSLRQLEALVAVLETGSITRGAARMHISQPAISRLISSLEADTGYPMFRRMGGRIVATAEATMLREEIQNALAAVDRVSRRALQIGNRAQAPLTVCAFPWFASTVLPQLLSRFHAEHPTIPIVLNGMGVHRLVEMVASQRADFVICEVPPHVNGIVAEHLCRYEAVCVMRADNPLAALPRVPLAALAREQFIFLREEDERQPVVARAFENLAIELRPSVEVNLGSSACAWIATAGGVSVLDPFSAGEWHGQLVRVKTQPAIWFDLWVLRPEAKPLTRVASAFLALLREHVLSSAGASAVGERGEPNGLHRQARSRSKRSFMPGDG